VKVLVSIPNTGMIHKLVSQCAMRLLGDGRHEVRIIQPTWRPYEHNLNRIVRDIREQDVDYWLNIDSDNPPIRNPLDLVDLDLDLVGCPTPVYHDQARGTPIYFNAMDWDESGEGWRPHAVPDGLQEVDAVGTGCFVAARRTVLALKRPFARTTDQDGIVEYGPDYNWCRRLKREGFKVWAHFDYPCRHFHTVDLMDLAQRFGEVCDG